MKLPETLSEVVLLVADVLTGGKAETGRTGPTGFLLIAVCSFSKRNCTG